jgi:hypothetical protein
VLQPVRSPRARPRLATRPSVATSGPREEGARGSSSCQAMRAVNDIQSRVTLFRGSRRWRAFAIRRAGRGQRRRNRRQPMAASGTLPAVDRSARGLSSRGLAPAHGGERTRAS